MTRELTKLQREVLDIAAKAYPDPHLVAGDAEGDGLGQFIYNEICDVTMSIDGREDALQQAAQAVAKAALELNAVYVALWTERVR